MSSRFIWWVYKPSENGFAIYCLPHQSAAGRLGFRELSELKSIETPQILSCKPWTKVVTIPYSFCAAKHKETKETEGQWNHVGMEEYTFPPRVPNSTHDRF
jgi:hypothetical protein